MREPSVEESRLRQLLGRDDAEGAGDLGTLAELLASVAVPPGGGSGGGRQGVAGEEAALAAFRAARAEDAAAVRGNRHGGGRARERRATALSAVTVVVLGGGLAATAGDGGVVGGEDEPGRHPLVRAEGFRGTASDGAALVTAGPWTAGPARCRSGPSEWPPASRR